MGTGYDISLSNSQSATSGNKTILGAVTFAPVNLDASKSNKYGWVTWAIAGAAAISLGWMYFTRKKRP